MMRILVTFALLGLSGLAAAAGGSGALYQFDPDISNKASVQRGAKNFMNYCSGCHSLRFLRYNRMAEDNNIPEDLLRENLMFTSDKVGDHILSAMPAEVASGWFGQPPPDLSLTTRARGADWVYSFLMSFYLDESKANGVNNAQLPGASMPHVLGHLQGYQRKVEHDEGGKKGAVPVFETAMPGELTPKQYHQFTGDLVNFLSYAAEPGREAMHSVGRWVLTYLLVLLIPLTYLIKREFWKDVH